MVPFFSARDVELAVTPERALEAVRDAFVAYAQGEWSMPPKVYVPAYPAGDFRAMPALGAGHAVLKWVTSFPGNPSRGLPTVTGLVLLSDAGDGTLRAVLDAGAVTALRTGAAAVLAAETLARTGRRSAAVVGAGVNGQAVARTFAARGYEVLVWDIDPARAEAAAHELGVSVAAAKEAALGAEVVATVTPGHEILFPAGSLRPGQHVSLMGADGPGKAEIAVEELRRASGLRDDREQPRPATPADSAARVRLFADDWEQASHNGDLARAVEGRAVGRKDVIDLGAVLAGQAPGRGSPEEITLFDSTGLAIHDLAVALAAMEAADELDLPTIEI
jgi:alanine dehydrogenase